MRILLSNDDGIHAPGLEVLERIARQFSDDIWVVAPESDQSGVGHGLSISMPLRARPAGDRRFAISGTPTDCVIIAVKQLMDSPPDLILSGVNSGQNIADDVTYSGTVAAAMEGALIGIRSVALSQAHTIKDGARHVPWEVAAAHGAAVLDKTLGVALSPDRFVNINFPNCLPDAVEGIEVTRQGRLNHGLLIDRRLDGRNFPYHWITFDRSEPPVEPGTELHALRNRRISVSVLTFDLTDHESNRAMQAAFG
ncbi:MAG: 5'/3'-nucleotidase SurE [Rhizobiaceae bacterium]|jgi:5'-nucleotidase|nr:5'/3'-nucleotidase SurE [Rhizobiaceae bacterium]